MEIKLLQTKQVNGVHGVKGDEFNVSDRDGNYMVKRGFAEEVTEEEETEEEEKPKAKAKK